MKIQGITGQIDGTSISHEGIQEVQDNLKQPVGTEAAAKRTGQLKNSDIPAGLFELLQIKQSKAGLQEFQALQNSPQMDMGNIKSRDLGNMLSGELVRIGEAVAKAQNPNVDFGDLPSRALTEMGKDVIKSE